MRPSAGPSPSFKTGKPCFVTSVPSLLTVKSPRPRVTNALRSADFKKTIAFNRHIKFVAGDAKRALFEVCESAGRVDVRFVAAVDVIERFNRCRNARDRDRRRFFFISRQIFFEDLLIALESRRVHVCQVVGNGIELRTLCHRSAYRCENAFAHDLPLRRASMKESIPSQISKASAVPHASRGDDGRESLSSLKLFAMAPTAPSKFCRPLENQCQERCHDLGRRFPLERQRLPRRFRPPRLKITK